MPARARPQGHEVSRPLQGLLPAPGLAAAAAASTNLQLPAASNRAQPSASARAAPAAPADPERRASGQRGHWDRDGAATPRCLEPGGS